VSGFLRGLKPNLRTAERRSLIDPFRKLVVYRSLLRNLDYESAPIASAGRAGSLFVLALLLLVGMQSLKESEACRGCANQRTAIRRGRLHEPAPRSAPFFVPFLPFPQTLLPITDRLPGAERLVSGESEYPAWAVGRRVDCIRD